MGDYQSLLMNILGLYQPFLYGKYSKEVNKLNPTLREVEDLHAGHHIPTQSQETELGSYKDITNIVGIWEYTANRLFVSISEKIKDFINSTQSFYVYLNEYISISTLNLIMDFINLQLGGTYRAGHSQSPEIFLDFSNIDKESLETQIINSINRFQYLSSKVLNIYDILTYNILKGTFKIKIQLISHAQEIVRGVTEIYQQALGNGDKVGDGSDSGGRYIWDISLKVMEFWTAKITTAIDLWREIYSEVKRDIEFVFDQLIEYLDLLIEHNSGKSTEAELESKKREILKRLVDLNYPTGAGAEVDITTNQPPTPTQAGNQSNINVELITKYFNIFDFNEIFTDWEFTEDKVKLIKLTKRYVKLFKTIMLTNYEVYYKEVIKPFMEKFVNETLNEVTNEFDFRIFRIFKRLSQLIFFEKWLIIGFITFSFTRYIEHIKELILTQTRFGHGNGEVPTLPVMEDGNTSNSGIENESKNTNITNTNISPEVILPINLKFFTGLIYVGDSRILGKWLETEFTIMEKQLPVCLRYLYSSYPMCVGGRKVKIHPCWDKEILVQIFDSDLYLSLKKEFPRVSKLLEYYLDRYNNKKLYKQVNLIYRLVSKISKMVGVKPNRSTSSPDFENTCPNNKCPLDILNTFEKSIRRIKSILNKFDEILLDFVDDQSTNIGLIISTLKEYNLNTNSNTAPTTPTTNSSNSSNNGDTTNNTTSNSK